MSHHILHIFSHGARLSKEHGFLVMKTQEGSDSKRLPISDIRAMVLAARGCQISMSLLSALLEANCVVLHCDSNYKPIGWTTPLHRVTRPELIEQQFGQSKNHKERLWNYLIAAKINNQHWVATQCLGHSKGLQKYLKRVDEAASARLYWAYFFKGASTYFPQPGRKRSDRSEGDINHCLNYGYAVLSALIHRSIVIHGLNPILGVHHKYRQGNWALVYDLMEPFRPFVDRALITHMREHQTNTFAFVDWCRAIGQELKDVLLQTKRGKFKLCDSIDLYIQGFAQQLAKPRAKPDFFLPNLEHLCE